MSIYVIGDTHLSFGVKKPMDVFGGWENYTDKLKENWNRRINQNDTVVLAGDISWGMTMIEAEKDFKWLDNLPGKKIVLKGNHDYWWGSVSSMKKFLSTIGVTSIDFLHNNSFQVEDINLCGSRGWLFEDGQEHNEKILNREAIRIEASLKSVENPKLESILFLHYPPIYYDQKIDEYIEIMHNYNVKRCYYGHIHGNGHSRAVTGNIDGIEFRMISADYIDFSPLKIV